MHLDQLQRLSGYGDRVDRFAIATRSPADIDTTLARLNHVAFGFRAYRSRDIAVETSRTFQVVSRFHRAIGVITIVASAVFLLCIMLLKVDERRRDVAALRLMGISRSLDRAVDRHRGRARRRARQRARRRDRVGRRRCSSTGTTRRFIARRSHFAVVTPPIVALAVSLSLVLGVVAGLCRVASAGADPAARVVRALSEGRPLRAVHHRCIRASRPHDARHARRRGLGGDAARHGDALDRHARVVPGAARLARVTTSARTEGHAAVRYRRDDPRCERDHRYSPRNPDVRDDQPRARRTIHISARDGDVSASMLGIDPTVQGDYERLAGRDVRFERRDRRERLSPGQARSANRRHADRRVGLRSADSHVFGADEDSSSRGGSSSSTAPPSRRERL